MTSTDVQTMAFLFLICLPASMVVWAVVLVGVGFVRSVPSMPWEFRLAARVMEADRSRSAPILTVPVALFCLVVSNISAPLIFVSPYGPTSDSLAVMYLLVQLLWLDRVRRAAHRG